MKSFGLPVVLLILQLFICRGFSVAISVNEPNREVDPTTLKLYDQEVEATSGELNEGMDYFEGDIKLTQQLRDYIKSTRERSNLQTRALIKDARKLWPNHVVPYSIADDLSAESRGYIQSAVNEWSSKTCLTFRPKTDADEDYIDFVYEVGCSSYVGRIGGGQTISVGNADGAIVCRHGNIVHEIAHSLGFFHEHSRPDRDDYVTVHWDNIEGGYQKNFEKETTDTVDSLEVGYDYGSVMHYGEFFFTKEKGLRTLEPTQTTSAVIGQRVGLSDLDVQQGNLLYQCPDYRDEPVKDNKTKQDSVDKELWERPLREHEVKVLRSKVQKRKHEKHSVKAEASVKKDATSRNTEKTRSHLHTILKSKTTPKTFTQAKTSDKPITHATADSRSMVFKEHQLKPQLRKTYRTDGADKLKGEGNEGDMLPYSRGFSVANSVKEPNREVDPTTLKLYDQEVEATYGELNEGMDYFEGDIKLTQQLRDYITSTREKSNLQTRALIRDARKLWPNHVVPYSIADDLSAESRGYIQSAVGEWSSKTCLTFRPKTDADEDYIDFVYEVGCSSYVGRIGGGQTISVGNADGAIVCKHGNIVHEIAHSLGFFHEHSRPDRDDYVTVHWDNIEGGYQKNFEKETTDTVDSLEVGYDYGSVMHYGEFFFTKEQGLRTLEPKQTTSAVIGQRVGLSDLDVQQGNLLYQCPGYRDEPVKDNKTKQDSVDKELWERPLREHEIKVLRSKVQKHKHKKHSLKTEASVQKGATSHNTEKKSSHLHTILKSKTTLKTFTQAKTSDKAIKHATADSRSMVFKEHQLKPQLREAYRVDEADILEGDDDEGDMLPYSRDVGTPVSAPETPNQLATDRATLAQEEEDSVQQQDNDDIGEENLGKDFFEGDMMLTPEQQVFLDKIKKGDDTQDGTKRALIKDKMYLWPKAKVYYNFDKGVDRIGRRRARAAMRHWQKHTCLKFKRVKNPPEDLGYINFVFEGGCASRVGRGGDKSQKLTIGSPALRCKVGNIIHELGHAVGFFHEHSRPDRNEYVRILKKNILPGYERNFFRFGRKWIDSRDVPYDYGSIMHYNRAFFSRFPVMLDTLIPLHRDVDIGQRKALSRFDILQANLLYQCDGRKRLTDEEIEQLKEESYDQLSEDSVICADVYDRDSCQSVKSWGYCQKFPHSMRTTCGITCNLCGMNAKKKEAVQGNHGQRA